MYCLNPKIHVSIFLKMVGCSDKTTLRHLSDPYGKDHGGKVQQDIKVTAVVNVTILFCSSDKCWMPTLE